MRLRSIKYTPSRKPKRTLKMSAIRSALIMLNTVVLGIYAVGYIQGVSYDTWLHFCIGGIFSFDVMLLLDEALEMKKKGKK